MVNQLMDKKEVLKKKCESLTWFHEKAITNDCMSRANVPNIIYHSGERRINDPTTTINLL